MEFTETVTLEIPNIEMQLAEFSESFADTKQALIIEIAAIHEGTTANFNHYTAEELEASLGSWTSPYPKPIILHHDPMSESMGRVMGAKLDKEADGTPYVRLQVAVTDPEAIQKVRDQRYLTGSVGGKAGEALCSICGSNWANASMAAVPCRHSRGKNYKGKIATMEMKNISWKEYSFVNMPADQQSSIRSVGAESEDGWVSPARFYSLDMSQEKIVEFTESEVRNALPSRKKESASLYLGLKGAFLSSMAVASLDNHEEKVMAETVVVTEEDEDILAVTEGLSADLAKASEEPEEKEEKAEEDEVLTAETEESTPTEEEATEEVAATEEGAEAEETERPEGQAKKHDSDIDMETSEKAPLTREADEVETPEATEEIPEEVEEEVTDLEAPTEKVDLESRVAELEAHVASLLDENGRLKKALLRGLAERVVDTKIALGVVEGSDREAMLTEHGSRSAASLADSLRDLVSMKSYAPALGAAPVVIETSLAVDTDKEAVVTFGDVGETEPKNDVLTPEDIFTDVFMGRRAL